MNIKIELLIGKKEKLCLWLARVTTLIFSGQCNPLSWGSGQVVGESKSSRLGLCGCSGSKGNVCASKNVSQSLPTNDAVSGKSL